METTLVGIIGSLVLVLLGWLGMAVRKLSSKVEELEGRKIDKADFHLIREDIHKILDQIMELKLEHARWQGRSETQNNT